MRKVSLHADKNGNDRISDILQQISIWFCSSADHVDESGNVQTVVCSEERYIELSEPVRSTISTAMTVLCGAVVCAIWH